MSRIASYAKIDYTLRRRKQIERKIIIEMLSRIRSIDDFHYIGMGSIYYYDFLLFHKFLNIRKMTSVDDKGDVKRFEFNKPYSFIKLRNTTISGFLNTYTFEEPAVFWLDYDSTLYDPWLGGVNEFILNDIRMIITSGTHPSFLIVTIDIEPPRESRYIEDFQNTFRAHLMTKYLKDIYRIQIKKFAHDYRQMIQCIVLNHVEECNKYLEAKFRKIFAFSYKDTAPMYTIGLFRGSGDQYKDFLHCCKDIEFVNGDRRSITAIDVPILTIREKLYLDQKLHRIQRKYNRASDRDKVLKEIIDGLQFEVGSKDALKSYMKFYRYYPQYHEDIL